MGNNIHRKLPKVSSFHTSPTRLPLTAEHIRTDAYGFRTLVDDPPLAALGSGTPPPLSVDGTPLFARTYDIHTLLPFLDTRVVRVQRCTPEAS